MTYPFARQFSLRLSILRRIFTMCQLCRIHRNGTWLCRAEYKRDDQTRARARPHVRRRDTEKSFSVFYFSIRFFLLLVFQFLWACAAVTLWRCCSFDSLCAVVYEWAGYVCIEHGCAYADVILFIDAEVNELSN